MLEDELAVDALCELAVHTRILASLTRRVGVQSRELVAKRQKWQRKTNMSVNSSIVRTKAKLNFGVSMKSTKTDATKYKPHHMAVAHGLVMRIQRCMELWHNEY